VERRAASDDLV